jgi:hypothetical protein
MMTFPYIMENKKCSKPPSKYQLSMWTSNGINIWKKNVPNHQAVMGISKTIWG